jgi:hypothetical protein
MTRWFTALATFVVCFGGVCHCFAHVFNLRIRHAIQVNISLLLPPSGRTAPKCLFDSAIKSAFTAYGYTSARGEP